MSSDDASRDDADNAPTSADEVFEKVPEEEGESEGTPLPSLSLDEAETPIEVDLSGVVDEPEPWIEFVCDWIELEGFWKLEERKAIEYIVSLRSRSKAVWKRLFRQVRQRCKSVDDLPRVQAADDWKGEVIECAERQSNDDVPTFERGDDVEVSKTLQDDVENHAGPGLVYDLGRFWQYSESTGTWQTVPIGELSKCAQKYAGAVDFSRGEPRAFKLSNRKIEGAIKLLKDRVDESGDDFDEIGFFDEVPTGVTFTNAFVQADFDEGDLDISPPAPEQRSRVGIDVPLVDPDEQPAPEFEKYLDSVFDGDAYADEKRQLLLEFAGCALLGVAPKLRKALVLYDATDRGEGENGKSVIIKILSEMLPKHATSSIPPQEFNERFKAAALAGTRVNYAAELPENDILASGTLKGMITGDMQTVERKNEDPFSFYPEAAHIFAANELPRVVATDDAFWKRWIVLPFSNLFTAEGKPGRDADPMLAERIIENETKGVLARCMEAARQRLERGRYNLPPSVERAKRRWRIGSNPVEQFLIDECENYSEEGPDYEPAESWKSNPNRYEHGRDLYEAYKSWSAATGHGTMSLTKFGGRVSKLIERVRWSDGVRYRVQLKPPNERVGNQGGI